MPRLSAIIRPGIEGMNTDQPTYIIGENESAFTQDGIAPEGILRQRRGWGYAVGTWSSALGATPYSVVRQKFILSGTTTTLVSHGSYLYTVGNDENISYSTVYRCSYRDMAVFCGTNGMDEAIFVSGAANNDFLGTGTFTGTTAALIGSLSASSPSPNVGAFIQFTGTQSNEVTVMPRTLNYQNTSNVGTISFEDIYSGGGTHVPTIDGPFNHGLSFPCVEVYNAGLMDISSGTASVTGVDFSSSAEWGGLRQPYKDAIIVQKAGNNSVAGDVISSPTPGVSSFGVLISDLTDWNYSVVRRCPFKDAAAHKNSLCGAGVAQFPNRVYISPPGWNPAIPPGFVPPVDITDSGGFGSSNTDDFLLFYTEVPAPYDGDSIVAILSTPNPLLVLKRRAVHGIYGSYPDFAQELLASGPGCIDLRSAVSVASIQAWAGEEGVFAYYDGQILDLTDGKINREWRGLTADFDFGVSDYCSIGEVYGHLLVHITTDSGSTQRTYAVDVRDPYNPIWVSRWTNHNARHFFSAKVDGEPEDLYWVSDDEQGRVMASKGCFDGTGSYADGDDTEPVLKFHSGLNLVGAAEIEGEGLMTDLNIHANVLDTGSAATLVASVVHGGGIGQDDSNETKVAGTITGDGVDRADRNDFEINRTGRFQQVRLETGTTTATTSKIEVPEIVCEFIDLSMGT